MKAHLTLNIADVEQLICEAAKARGIECVGFTIKSWNTPLVVVNDGTMTFPVRHHLVNDHKSDWLKRP